MNTRSFATRSLLVLVAAFGPWLACVSEDPGPRATGTATADGGHAVGDRLGACFPDGKCKEGLLCRDGEICLQPDEPKPVTPGGSVAEASTDASPESGTDADTACTLTPLDNALGPQCLAGRCAPNRLCCKAGTAPAVCAQAQDPVLCAPPSAVWACEQSDVLPCTAASPNCCVLGVNAPAGRCPLTVTRATSGCTGGPTSCEVNGGIAACGANGACSSPKKCQAVEVQTALGFTVVMKLCVPQ